MSWELNLCFLFDVCIPVRMNCKCKNNPDRFYHICSNVVLPSGQAKITDFVKKAYCDYFEIKLRDQDKPFAPYICCKTWGIGGMVKGRICHLPFQWSGGKGKDHITDFYFCMINLKGINRKNKHHVHYPMFLLPLNQSFMAQTFLFLSLVVTWNIGLIPNLVTWLL